MSGGLWVNIILVVLVAILLTWAFLKTRSGEGALNIRKQWFDAKADRDKERIAEAVLSKVAAAIRDALEKGDSQLAYRNIEQLKTALAEHPAGFAKWCREVTRLLAVAIRYGRDDMAGHLVDTYRATHRAALGRNEDLKTLIDQLILVAFITLRGKRSYLACRAMDQLFLLASRTYARFLFEHGQLIMQGIAVVGRLALRRREKGLVQDIMANMRSLLSEVSRKQDEAGGQCWNAALHVYLRLLDKAVNQGLADSIELILDETREHFEAGFDQYPEELQSTVKEWGDAAKLAALTRHLPIARLVMTNLMLMAEMVADRPDTCRSVLMEAASIVLYSLTCGLEKQNAELFFPLLDQGRKWMNEELRSVAMIAIDRSYRGKVLKILLEQVVTVFINISRQPVEVYEYINLVTAQWAKLPYNKYRQKSAAKFKQLLLLFWLQNRRKAISRDPELYPQIKEQLLFTSDELGKFAFLDRSTTVEIGNS